MTHTTATFAFLACVLLVLGVTAAPAIAQCGDRATMPDHAALEPSAAPSPPGTPGSPTVVAASTLHAEGVATAATTDAEWVTVSHPEVSLMDPDPAPTPTIDVALLNEGLTAVGPWTCSVTCTAGQTITHNLKIPPAASTAGAHAY